MLLCSVERGAWRSAIVQQPYVDRSAIGRRSFVTVTMAADAPELQPGGARTSVLVAGDASH